MVDFQFAMLVYPSVSKGPPQHDGKPKIGISPSRMLKLWTSNVDSRIRNPNPKKGTNKKHLQKM